MDFKWND